MKVVFIEDVPNVAHAGETKVVADGYARNYLLPRKLAVQADSQASAVIAAQLKKREKLVAQTEAEMKELAARLEGMAVTLKAKAGAKERLYGSVTSADIADELSRRAGSLVDKRKVELAEPIHQLGSYDVTVRFTSEITAVIKLTVAAEEAAPAEAPEEKAVEAPAEAVAEEKPAKKAKKAEKVEKTEEKEEAAAEKKEKKTRAKKEKAEDKEEAKPEKKEKKPKAKKEAKVEEAGEKDAEPGE